LAQYLLQLRDQRGAIVKSITTTSMIYRLGAIYSVPVFEMPVGFKYIGPKMLEEDALIGGEESGGFGFRGHIPERDGILSGLFLLDMMVQTGKSPSELLRDLYTLVGPHYYERTDFNFPPEQREEITLKLAALKPEQVEDRTVEGIDTVDGFRYRMSDGSWLLIRLSGTEPLLRIYAESGSIEQVRRLLQAGTAMAGVHADDRS
ncbi:MAG: phosphoglucomutase/phosphomannomutase family protein, partial [Dehalococcoidia bacterium]|nr:phosphoglucomutase/phosphomannomutase family protein [Dehalococcoidia bacterium]